MIPTTRHSGNGKTMDSKEICGYTGQGKERMNSKSTEDFQSDEIVL